MTGSAECPMPSEVAEMKKPKALAQTPEPLKYLTLDEFWRAKPQFIVGPLIVGALIRAVWELPAAKAYFERNNMEMLGFWTALHYTAFALVLSFAFHGFVVVYRGYMEDGHKVQPDKELWTSPAAAATRSSSVIMSELVYSALPVLPVSSSWVHFLAALVGFAVVWDALFFVGHGVMHKFPTLYKNFHKTHHTIKDPNCFGAYFVTYQSHLILEQLVVIACCATFVPRDVLMFTLYTGTFGTFSQHAGFEMGHLKVPFTPITLDHILTALSFYALPLGGMTTTHHDWHHEKFNNNYALSFTYLDRLFGTLQEGRPTGEAQVKMKAGKAQ
mmetsp:Transcript_4086/g.11859  ORF Transcript_4086/g.11859 Transcript_4086/m.11859 type:complete len:329 (+) Transcript_4086:75-1061(+)